MNPASLINEYNFIRQIDNRNMRINYSLNVAGKMSSIISNMTITPEYAVDGGEGLLYTLYIKQKGIFTINNIINLSKVYCTTKHPFIGDIARTVLCSIFAIPSPCHLSSDDIYSIFTYFNENLPLEVSNSELDRHNHLCEILAKFLMMYSKKIYPYLKNDIKQVEKINKIFRACLKGQATGDAIGFLVEGQSRSVAEEYINSVVKPKNFNYGVHKDFGCKGQPRYTSDLNTCMFKLGQYTDDTQLCRELLRSIEKVGKFDSSDFSKRLIILFEKSKLLRSGGDEKINTSEINSGIVGYGKTTLKTVQCLADGCSWEQSGILFKSQGNGGCMRAAPLGVLYLEQPWKIADIASEQSLGTHGSSICRATCVMVATAARLACESKLYRWSNHLIKYPSLFCKRLSEQVEHIDVNLANAIKLIPNWLTVKDEQVLVNFVTSKGYELGDSLWGNGKVISAGAVQASLFAIICFLKYPDSYEDSISMAIRAGGDTDTVAAMCGAITSARTSNSLDININDRGEWGITQMNELSNKVRYKVLNTL